MRSLKFRLMSTASAAALTFTSLPVAANPLGGHVVAGAATISGETTNLVTVDQSTEKGIINWQTFNLAPGDTTRFVQPDTAAVTLNRVAGNLGASQINGMISANGGVYVVNPDGILFGPNAVINTGSFLGATHDIANSDFMAGNLNFDISGSPSASIVNEGTITAANGGFAALVAPGVRNDGIITANLGNVALASGNGFTLDLYGDNLITLQASDSVAGQVTDVATGQTLKALVQNTGTLRANGGKVALSAVAARQVLDGVINTSGTVEANTVGTRKGQVIFGAATASSKPAGAPRQTVKVSGQISSAGRDAGTSGGKIQVTGEDIQLANATLDASGQTGGGTIIVGGDFKGGDPTAPAVTMFGQHFETSPVPAATTVNVDGGALLNTSAIQSGNGGKIVVWADDTTTDSGILEASGGLTSGNGGFAEVSGRDSVDFTGIQEELQAPRGKAGRLLFDPNIENISSGIGDTLAALLDRTSSSSGGDLDITFSAGVVSVYADTINILPNVSILKTSGGDATLALLANSGINIGSNVVIGSSQGALSLYLDADVSNASLFPGSNVQFFVTPTIQPTLPEVMGALTYAKLFPNAVNLNDFANFFGSTEPPTLANLSVLDVAPRPSALSFSAPPDVTANLQGQYAGVLGLLSSARISIDPTARFYLYGGTYTAWGNDYQIGKSNYQSAESVGDPQIALASLLNAVAPSYDGVTCSLSLCGTQSAYQFVPGQPGSGVGLTYAVAASYDVDHRLTAAPPASVLSSGALPGITRSNGSDVYSFASLLATGQSVGLSADQTFAISSHFNTIYAKLAPLISTAAEEAAQQINARIADASAQSAALLARYGSNAVKNKIPLIMTGMKSLGRSIIPIYSIGEIVTNQRLPLGVKIALTLLQATLTSVDLLIEGVTITTGTPIVLAVNFAFSIALAYAEKIAETGP